MKYNIILKEVLNRTSLGEEARVINLEVKNFLDDLKNKIGKSKVKPQIFIGGSYAKNTMIKKNKYDVDVFLRYDKGISEVSGETGKILKGIKNTSVVHGSRDYFRVKINNKLYVEIIPVRKVNSPEKSENITDLSYSHVKYINKKIKNKKILEEIRIAKAFCYANGFYGAESYIKGFSGYSLELLVYHYKSFIKMIKELSKPFKEKIIIDIEKKYKNKKNILLDLNSSKLSSPIILIDPTYKQRNALAALSYGTFEKFRRVCYEFLKKPSIKYFEEEKIDLEKLENDALKKKYEFIFIKSSTEKPEGDVAGSKLLKFYNHLSSEMERFFEIKDRGFNYDDKQSGEYFFVVKKKNFIIYDGPSVKDTNNVKKFKSEHKQIRENKGRIYAKVEIKFSVKEFVSKWVIKNKKKIYEMSIKNVEIID